MKPPLTWRRFVDILRVIGAIDGRAFREPRSDHVVYLGLIHKDDFYTARKEIFGE